MGKESREIEKSNPDYEVGKKRKIVFWSLIASGIGVIVVIALLLIFLLPKDNKYEIDLGTNVSEDLTSEDTLTGEGSYKKGESVTIVAEDIEGYRFTGWSYGGNIISTDKEYTFKISEETEGEYTANYAKEYNITISSGDISVAIEGNKTNAIVGEAISFTITPNENYRLANVSINNGNVTYTMQNNTYFFTMPAENVTIDVTYSQLFDISVTSEHGSVSITDNKTEGIAGESISFTITPEENYRLANVSINNGNVTYTMQDNTYSFTMPAGDVEITVTYNQEYAITIDENSSEYIQIEKQKAIEGEQVEFTVLERDGYRIDEVKYNDTTLQSGTNTYTFNMPAENVTIVVTYIQQFEVILQSDMENADLSGADTYDIGSEVTITASTNIEDQDGNQYRLIGWQHNEEFIPAEEGGIYTFTLTAETAGTYTAIYEMGYAITVEESSAQYIQIDKGVGYENDTITFTTTFEDKITDTQIVENIIKITSNDQDIEYTKDGNQCFFTMPAGDVTITVNTNTLNRITDFEINGSMITKYNGSASEVVVPSSYYPYIQENGTLEFNNYDEFNNYMQEELAQYQIWAGYFTYSLNGIDYPNIVKDIEAWLAEIQSHSQDEQFNLKIKLPTEYMVTEEDAIELGDMLAASTIGPFAQIAMGNTVLSFTYKIGENEPVNVDASNVVDIVETITDPETMLPIKFTNIKYGKTYACVGEGQKINFIGYSVFSSCSSLTDIYYKGTLDQWLDITFESDWTPNTNLNLYFNNELAAEIIINKDIPANAFDNITSLTKVTIGEGVTSIGSSAFYNCSSLTKVTLPSSLTSIGSSAFYYCNNLQYNEYENGRYLGNDENPYVALISVIDQSVDNFNIHENCKIIYDYAFSGCSNLTSISLPSSLTSIGDDAFQFCSSLNEITIPEGVTSIGDAFERCTSLTEITLPSSLTSINSEFRDCSSLTDIYYKGTLDQWLDINFGSGWGPNTNFNLYFKNELAEEIIINKDIPAYAFLGIKSLTKVTIGKGVTSIGNDAFYNCSNLTEVTLPSTLTFIGSSAFYNCSNLTEITIPEGVTSIGNYAFSRCNNLTSITILEGVTSIGDFAFLGCSKLITVVIESDNIYKVVTSTNSAGYLLSSATTVRVLTSIVETNDNSYLENEANFTTSIEGEYTVFSKVN